MKQSRWRSKLMWAALVSQLLALAQLTGLLDLIGMDAGTAADVAAIVLAILTTVGVVNNPTRSDGW